VTGFDYQSLFAATPTPYLILSRELRIVEVNAAYLRATATSRDALIGALMFEAFPDNPADSHATGVRNLRKSLESVLATAEPDVMPLQKYDIRVPDHGGVRFEERWWSPINTPVLAPDGSVELIIHRVEDVTDFVRSERDSSVTPDGGEQLRRQAEEMRIDLFNRGRELEQVNRRLRLANARLEERTAELRREHRAKDRFIATLSHELRNPLAAIQGAVENLARDVPADDGGVQEMLRVLERQAATLTRMTDDLLDLSRAVVDKLDVRLARHDLGSLIAVWVEPVRSAFATGERELTMTLPNEQVWADVDEVRLSQALSNLLSNAEKFTTAGGAVAVRLTARGGNAVIAVTDDGRGFDPAMGDELFEPFAQEERSSAGGQPGLGLGLSIVRAVVEQHGGNVGARSDGPGTGATFTIALPLASEPAPAPPRAQADEPAPLRVLLVEDHADVAATYSSLLAGLGHDVEVARSGRAALSAARRAPPDVVLCDIGLPDVDGYEVARRLRGDQRTAHLRLVAVSGYGRAADRTESSRAGFDAHLVKPVSPAELTEALASLSKGR
jgi:signal transduction histidine kinase/CheY-like chemotaxis protein